MNSLVFILLAVGVDPGEPPSPPPSPAIDIDPRKRLVGEDLARKNESWYFTGLPLAAYDPNFGYGGGARLYYYFDGQRSDPLFAYTPYFHRIFLQAFASTRGLQFHWLDYDAPYLLGTPYRLRVQLIYERNLAHNYFGTGSRSLDALVSPADGRRYRSMVDYDASLAKLEPGGVAYTNYDRVDVERPILFINFERSFLSGTLRPLGGFTFSHAGLRDYTGKRVRAVDEAGADVRATMGRTRLAEDCDAGAQVGCAGGWDNTLRLALSYDTRDFEPDPNRGLFFDAVLDLGTGVLGSAFDYARFLLSARVYVSPFDNTDVVLALRGTYEVQSAGTPFFSMDLFPWTEDPRAGMGGIRTMRGFKQDRFVGPVMALVNAEVRWTFTRFTLLKQKFALTAVAFGDTGRAFDAVEETSFERWQPSLGGALRIPWNEATVVTVEYGVSREDTGFYMNFNHIF